jgi:hypothetical protein
MKKLSAGILLALALAASSQAQVQINGSANSGVIIGSPSNTMTGAGPVVNLLSFAKCDGTTDDTVAIQSALTSAGTLAATFGAATVYVPDGRVCLVGHNPSGTTGNIFTRPPNVNLNGFGTIKIGPGIQWQFLIATTNETGGSIQNVTFDGNGANNPVTTAPGGGVIINSIIDEEGGNDFTVSNCTFLNINGIFSVLVNGNGTAGSVVSITNNKLLNLGAGATVFYDTSEVRSNADHTTVTGNNFQSPAGNGHGINTAIEVDAGHSIITNNIISQTVTGIIYAPGIPSVSTSEDTVIANNTMTVLSEGVSFWTAQSSPGTQGLLITGNDITINRNLEGTTQGGGEGGIAWFTSSTFPLTDATISNNVIRWITETSQYPASTFLAGIAVCKSSTSPLITNLVITGNTVDNSPGNGIAFCPSGGTVNGAQITNNVITNVGQDLISRNFANALVITGATSFGPGMIVEGNTFIDNQTTSTMVDGLQWLGTAGDNANINAVSSGNTVMYKNQPTASAFFYSTSHPYINERITNFSTNQSATIFGATTGNFTPAGSSIFDPSTSQQWTNTATNSEAFTVQQRQQTCTTVSITPSTVAGGIVSGSCAISEAATGHVGQASASDGSVQGNLIPQVSVNGTTVTITLTTILAGSGTAKTYNATIF